MTHSQVIWSALPDLVFRTEAFTTTHSRQGPLTRRYWRYPTCSPPSLLPLELPTKPQSVPPFMMLGYRSFIVSHPYPAKKKYTNGSFDQHHVVALAFLSRNHLLEDDVAFKKLIILYFWGGQWTHLRKTILALTLSQDKVVGVRGCWLFFVSLTLLSFLFL